MAVVAACGAGPARTWPRMPQAKRERRDSAEWCRQRNFVILLTISTGRTMCGGSAPRYNKSGLGTTKRVTAGRGTAQEAIVLAHLARATALEPIRR
jgi:hypothetical protein